MSGFSTEIEDEAGMGASGRPRFAFPCMAQAKIHARPMSEDNERLVSTKDEDEAAAQVVVPWDRLTADALRGVIVEFVTREGTEYGEDDVPLERKIEQVRRQIERGDVVILFHAGTETVNLARAKDMPRT
jgi:uncharacterized protein